MKVDLEKVFYNEEHIYGGDYAEILHLIISEDFEKATEVVLDNEGQSGWYSHHSLKFNYEGKRYKITFMEHTSDNVCDFEFTSDLMLLGDAEEMKKVITQESLEEMRNFYENKIAEMEKEERAKETQRAKQAKNEEKIMGEIQKMSPRLLREMDSLAKVFYSSHSETGSMLTKDIGDFLKTVSEYKK